MTDGKKIITWRVTDKDGNEIQPQHSDLFSGQSAAELLRHIEADRQRTAKLMGYASADEMEAGQRSALLRLADEYKQWSPGKELKTLAANFAEIKSSVDATLGHFTDAQEFLRQSGLSEFNEAVKLFSGKQPERIPAEVKPAPPKVEQTASGLSVVKRSAEIERIESLPFDQLPFDQLQAIYKRIGKMLVASATPKGRPSDILYDLAFKRIYTDKTHTPKEAFALFLEESIRRGTISGVVAAGDARKNFDQAMKYKRKKAKKGG